MDLGTLLFVHAAVCIAALLASAAIVVASAGA
jgi:hypothetical protein